jgi:hypothetical protein
MDAHDIVSFLPSADEPALHKVLGVQAPHIGAEFAPLLAEQFRRWVVANCAGFEFEHGQLPSRITIEMDIIVE